MKVTVIRHGFTQKRASGQDDIDRQLIPAGREFVPRLGEFDAVFSSPAQRCIETAKLASKQEPIIIKALSTHLWDGKINGQEGWELIEKCYYTPSGEMAELPLVMAWENISVPEQAAWELITLQAFEEIMLKVGDAKKILISSHQIHAQAIALKMMGNKNPLYNFVQGMYVAPGSSISFDTHSQLF